jgi:hypothetical protein
MKYLLMMNVSGRVYQYTQWSEQDWKRHLAFLDSFNDKLRQAGELVAIAALTAPDQAKLVRAGSDGQPITDGVFPETKEFLAGYWMVDVETPQRAYQLAAEASAAPGPGGKPLNMDIEVRQLMGSPAADL